MNASGNTRAILRLKMSFILNRLFTDEDSLSEVAQYGPRSVFE